MVDKGEGYENIFYISRWTDPMLKSMIFQS